MNRTVVITGANRGIGLELTRHYVAQGDQVICVCRRSSAELESIAHQVISGIDVSEAADVSRLADEIGDQTIDILINNAGIFTSESLENMDFGEVKRQFSVNTLAPLRITWQLLGNLTSGSKVIMITSRMGSMGDNSSGGYYGYRASKAALNAIGVSLAYDLAPQGISVALLHPGFVQTRMVKFSGDVTPEEAAAGLAQRIEELTSETSGCFRHANGDALPW
ncbi:SDR family oxidoreductase [Kistimonas asteriae]|uniref:SDR family oxidoreductase n=1 Tax=Kistimonas asteriae TaxID=517724 RepID=UPI001BA5554E|nr:SDR family oxidoreductase [Kistimonas asteriae]